MTTSLAYACHNVPTHGSNVTLSLINDVGTKAYGTFRMTLKWYVRVYREQPCSLYTHTYHFNVPCAFASELRYMQLKSAHFLLQLSVG